MNFSQCVVCMFGHKTIYKVTISKSTPKEIISFLKIPFQELQRTARLDYKVVSCICDITKLNPAHGNFNGWRVGRMLGWARACFKIETQCGCFLYHCISDGNQLFSENVGCHFHFILHVMSDKAAFVSRALLCVQCYRGTSISTTPTVPPAGREWICIYRCISIN